MLVLILLRTKTISSHIRICTQAVVTSDVRGSNSNLIPKRKPVYERVFGYVGICSLIRAFRRLYAYVISEEFEHIKGLKMLVKVSERQLFMLKPVFFVELLIMMKRKSGASRFLSGTAHSLS